jgi:hypothetical protein
VCSRAPLETPPKDKKGNIVLLTGLCRRMGVFGMSIMHHFDHRTDAGFIRAYDAKAARRQLQISIALVAVLALAAVALGMLARLDRPNAQERSAAIAVSSHHVAETLLDIRG